MPEPVSTDGLILVGIDGGGSRCRARARSQGGAVVGAAEGGSANVYLDFEGAIRTIVETVERSVGQASPSNIRLGLGLAGVSSPTVATSVRRALPGYASVSVTNDGVIACIGAHAGQDGGLVIAGTGSIAILRLRGLLTNIGGRGFLLGDDGSGAQMGRNAWRKALRAHDALEPWTPLLRGLMADFGDDPVAVIDWGRQAPSAAYAVLAPRIVAASHAGDPAALALLSDAGRSIAELILALAERGAPRISLVGGLADAIRPHLGSAALACLSPALADALEGALILARDAAQD